MCEGKAAHLLSKPNIYLKVKDSLSGFKIKKKYYSSDQPKCKLYIMLLPTLSVLAFEYITIDLFGGARHFNCAIVRFGIGRYFKPKMSL